MWLQHEEKSRTRSSINLKATSVRSVQCFSFLLFLSLACGRRFVISRNVKETCICQFLSEGLVSSGMHRLSKGKGWKWEKCISSACASTEPTCVGWWVHACWNMDMNMSVFASAVPQSNIHDNYYPSTLMAVHTYGPPTQVFTYCMIEPCLKSVWVYRLCLSDPLISFN